MLNVFYFVAGRRLNGGISLNTILQFITGSYNEPLLGFSIKPKIEFAENPSGFLPTANTCANLLKLPRVAVNEKPKEAAEVFGIYDHAFAQKYFGLP